MKIIVNADDFGKDENATGAILESFSKGFITQTTLMVNMSSSVDAVERAKKAGLQSRIGLHITLTEGCPLTSRIKGCRNFCAPDGTFLRDGVRCRQWRPYVGEELLALREELEAQIARFMKFGLQLMHCDSHHHVHMIPPVFYVLAPLLMKYGFRSIRTGIDIPWEHLFHPRIFGWAQRGLRKVFWPNRITQADHFGSVELMMRKRTTFRDCDIIEVMVHPRYNKQSRLVDFKSTDGRPMYDVFRDMSEWKGCLCAYGDLT